MFKLQLVDLNVVYTMSGDQSLCEIHFPCCLHVKQSATK